VVPARKDDICTQNKISGAYKRPTFIELQVNILARIQVEIKKLEQSSTSEFQSKRYNGVVSLKRNIEQLKTWKPTYESVG
jgi:hypothetical protein